jgi:aminoglycoside phosphotransferase (APT) family kinase protein
VPALEPFLRRQPPLETLRWVERAVGRGARVSSLRRMRGGTSSAVHAVNVVDARGQVHRLVLRRFVRADWFAREPDLAEREARVLQLLERSKVPAPRLVAVDPRGDVCDVPAVLMTRLPGRVDFAPDDIDAWLEQLAGALPAIHSVDANARTLVQPYAPYYDMREKEAPMWSRQRGAWEEALRIVREPRPASKRCFIHRDYHPANVLWSRGRLSGVIDWINASWGPPEIDVAHCRHNLVCVFGVDMADRFLRAYESILGVKQQPYWDLLSVLDSGMLSGPVFEGWEELGVTGLTARVVRRRLDDYLVGLVRRL